jgi:alcohol dehydrogenase
VKSNAAALPAALRHSPVRVVFASGALARLGELVRGAGGRRVLLVTDPGLVAAGHVARAVEALERAGCAAVVCDVARENPTTRHVADGLAVARSADVDFIVAVGGGSAMDCAKGINLLLTNGGAVADYRGVDKAARPLLPSILVPTTAGTGSEGQSFALIADAATHAKMACGDRRPPTAGGLRPCVAVLDPELTRTAPRAVTAAAGLDALAHAVETAGCRVRTADSLELSQAAWALLSPAFGPALADAADSAARAQMLLGAHLAGVAIELSMLGAAHACVNPLTARFGVTHGIGVGLLLPHVVRFNAAGGENPYVALDADAERLAAMIEGALVAAGTPRRLSELGVPREALGELAEDAARQWTAGFNPRGVDAGALRSIYETAF